MVTIQNQTTNWQNYTAGKWIAPGLVGNAEALDGHTNGIVIITETGNEFIPAKDWQPHFEQGMWVGFAVFGAAIGMFLVRRAFVHGDLID